MKWLLIALCLLLVAPAVAANDFTTINNSITLWTDTKTATDYYSVSSVNITIYNSTGSIVIANASMQQVATGLYSYTYTPPSKGIYYTASRAYNGTGSVVSLSSSTFAVVSLGGSLSGGSSTMIPITAIVMLIVAFVMLYISYQLDKEHIVIKFLLIMASVSILYLAAGSLVNTNEYCAITTESGAPSLSCFDTKDNTPTTMLKIIGYLLYLIIAYIAVYILFKVMEWLKNRGTIH